MANRSVVAQGVSLALHLALAAVLLVVLNRAAQGFDPALEPAPDSHIVYVASPGDGGGGGGYKAPAPPVLAEIPPPRPMAVVPTASIAPVDPVPSISAPVMTDPSAILRASGVDVGAVAVPRGGGGDGDGIGPGKGDGLGPGDATGVGDAGRAGTGGISWPVRTYEAKPQYTAPAMQMRIQGAVQIEAIIGPTGKVLSARVTRSLDARYGLDAAAIQAVMESKFLPCKKNGQPVACVVPFELQFTLR